MKSRNIHTTLLTWLAATVLLFGLQACTVRLVDNFDSASFEETIRLSKLVERFYIDLLQSDARQRQYKNFSNRYTGLEIELRALLLRNELRPDNEDSVKIVNKLLTLWIETGNRHKEKDTYTSGNAKLDKKRFNNMFTSALRAEYAKKKIRQTK